MRARRKDDEERTLSSLASVSTFSRFAFSFSKACFASATSFPSLFFSPLSAFSRAFNSFLKLSTSFSSSSISVLPSSSSPSRALNEFLSSATEDLDSWVSLREDVSSERRVSRVASEVLKDLRRMVREAESSERRVVRVRLDSCGRTIVNTVRGGRGTR